MKKYALYTKASNENSSYVTSAELSSLSEARAYFAGMKQLSFEKFDLLFHVKEVHSNKSNKTILFGNQ